MFTELFQLAGDMSLGYLLALFFAGKALPGTGAIVIFIIVWRISIIIAEFYQKKRKT